MRIDLDNIPLVVQSAMLHNILLAFEGKTFSKELAAHIVGGMVKLERLISSEKVAAEKPCYKPNGKWFCSANDVLVHCKNRRLSQVKPNQNYK